ncbi:uncharacterized protein LOC122376792, partial [Amphibalanus amphitrite]|uniref:uncharacterized protein LOC122376792 n=1 Tax=Amphibalanus amphitrite TaxID=1232801 RepID=UPI001C923C6A
AEDGDSGSNSKLTYRLEGGGKWSGHFSINRDTGEIRVKKPVSMELTEGAGSDRDPRRLPHSEPLSFEKSGSDRVEGRIELKVKVHDDGEPQLFSEVPVHIYRKDRVETIMTFLVKQDVDSVNRNLADVEKQLSVFTGGTAEITDIQPYKQDSDQNSGQQRAEQTVITARVTRPYGAIFNTTGLNGGTTSDGGDNGSNSGPVVQATVDNVWFWLLIVLALLILLAIIIGCCCYNCAFCYTCCPLLSCYKKKEAKDYDEEAVAYVGIENSQRVRSQGGRSGRVLRQMRRAVSGNAQRVRSAANAWPNGQYRTQPNGRRNSHSSTLRLMEAPADEPGRENVLLARHEMEDEMARHVALQNARGARDNQIILVPNEIGSLHRTNSRASRGGPKMYRVMGGDRPMLVRAAEGDEVGYQLEDLEDEELQRLEMERQSVILPQARRSPSVEVLTLNDNSGRDAEYRHHGNSETLRLHTSARPRRREVYIDEDGNEIERPTYRGRPRDDTDIQYGSGRLRLGDRTPGKDRHHRTRSEVLVLHEEDGEEEEEQDGRRGMGEGGGKAMLMQRFIGRDGAG